LVAAITEWGLQRDVVLIAEPWDLATYQLGGPQWPAPWRQWNDRFRDDIRSFVRGEPGLVRAVAQRIAGSDDIFGAGSGRTRTLNFVTAHDGLTMHDLTVVTSDRHRSWDCGDALRVQQVKNYMAFALLSRGAAMFVMGDECGRTQLGHDNPYDIDSPLTWMDWDRARVWDELTEFTATLVRLRALRGDVPPQMFGFRGALDDGDHSRSIAWHDGDLYVAANMWWEPLPCDVQAPGAWSLATSTAALHADAVAPRSIAIWHR
jgi:glycogen operon protein